ncbi:MAG: imelysin family protein, partial [Rhodocyclaceae bacterium]
MRAMPASPARAAAHTPRHPAETAPPYRRGLRCSTSAGALLLVMLWAAPLPAPAQSQSPPSAAVEATPDDYRRLNLELVDRHLLPRYAALAETTATLDARATDYCAQPDASRRDALVSAWHAGTDAWQGIQHVRFGPVELFMRSMRISFWPDPRNTAGRQLDTLLASRDAAALAPEAFARATIAVQGLPALERLLADPDALTGQDADESAWRCAVLRAITHNLASMAADTLQAWRDGDEAYRQVIARAAEPGGHYHLDREATQDLFKSLNTALELVAEHKLARPLGASRQAARPQLTEAWRSQRSLAHVRNNLAAAEAMYLGEAGAGSGGGGSSGGGGGFSGFVREIAGDAALD